MREFFDMFKLKISEDGKYVLLSIKDSEHKVSTYSIPRSEFEKLVANYNSMSSN